MPGPRRTAATLALLAGPVALLALVTPGAAVPAERKKPAAPVVATVTPASGTPGTRVVLTGRRLRGVTKVVFGSAVGSELVVTSGRSLSVTAPTHAAGPVTLRLVSKSGRRARGPLTFTYLAPPAPPAPPPTPPPPDRGPEVDLLTPSYGSAFGGTEVRITGVELAEASAVWFGTEPAEFRQVSATTLIATTPSNPYAGDAPVRVATPRGASPPGPTFQYGGCDAPRITWLDPGSGPDSGGTRVRMYGYDFDRVRSVWFGAARATAVAGGGAVLRVLTPALPPGRVPIRVVTACGASDPDEAAAYTFHAPQATITGVSPSEVPASGGEVTVRGTNFSGVTEVTLDGDLLTGWIEVSATELRVPLPPRSAGVRSLRVRTYEGGAIPTSNAADDVRHVAEPRVGHIEPQHAGLSGGRRVEISGSGFTGLGGATEVTFGGVPGTDLEIRSDSSLAVTAPAHAAGTVDVLVANAVGVSEPGLGDWFTFEGPLDRVGRVVEPPVPADGVVGSARLTSIACPGPGACFAVGSYDSAAGSMPLIEQQGGGTWSAVSLGLPPDAMPSYPQARLDQIACSRPDFCAAVGGYLAADGELRTLAATWNGAGWATTSLPAPVHDPHWDESPPRLDCTGSRDCIAVGYSGRAVLAYRDGRWAAGLMDASTIWPVVRDLDCSATECLVVGYAEADDETVRPFVQRWRAGSWQVERPGLPPDAGSLDANLSVVSCPADGSCVVAGNYGFGLLYSATLRGVAWTASAVPIPTAGVPTGSPYLGDLSCRTVDHCVLTGQYSRHFYADGWGSVRAMVVTRARGAWTAADAALPYADPYATWGELARVTCVAPASCVAIGYYDLADARTQGVVVPVRGGVVGDGVQVAVPMAGSEQDAVESWPGFVGLVADSPTTAVAVGEYFDAERNSHSMLLMDLPLG